MAGYKGIETLDNSIKPDNVPVDGELIKAISSNWAYDHAALSTAHQDAPTLIATHAADTDAHTRNLWEVVRTGQYAAFHPCFGTSAGTALVANTLYAMPLPIPIDVTIDYLILYINTVDSGSYLRLGIYADGTNLYPGALVANSEKANAYTSTGAKAVELDPKVSLTKGLYWVVVVSDGTGTLRNKVFRGPLLGFAAAFNEIDTLWSVAHTYGALPDPFTAGGSVSSTGNGATYGIWPRVYSLD